jgi:hypothetical protein
VISLLRIIYRSMPGLAAWGDAQLPSSWPDVPVLLHTNEGKRFHCRLCAVGADEGGWKQARDVLRHLKRDHFGAGARCHRWSVLFSWYYMGKRLTSSTGSDRLFNTSGELTRHCCSASAGL